MKRKMFFLTMALVLCLSVSGVNAASVSLISTPQDVGIGTGTVVFDLFADFSEFVDPGTLGGAVDITYNSDVLAFNSFTPSSAILSDGANTPYLGVESVIGSVGTLSQVGFANFDIFVDGFNLATFSIGTLVFDSIMAGSSTVAMATNNVLPWTEFDYTEFTPDYNDASVMVNAVPIPGAFILLCSGLVGLVGIRRRQNS